MQSNVKSLCASPVSSCYFTLEIQNAGYATAPQHENGRMREDNRVLQIRQI